MNLQFVHVHTAAEVAAEPVVNAVPYFYDYLSFTFSL